MTQVPISPFLPMHESILDALSPGGFMECDDPDHPAAPYLGPMIVAGWLHQELVIFTPRITITDAGRRRLDLQRLGEEPA